MLEVFKPIPLERKHPRKLFDCGDVVLNDWLTRYSIQTQKKGASRTYVCLDADGTIAGFYSLVYGHVFHSEATFTVAKGMPRHPIPVLLISRLAVSLTHQGLGIGRSLLRDAVERAISASEIAGLRAVVVHAKSEAVALFYQRFGFSPSEEDPLLLMISLKDAVAAL